MKHRVQAQSPKEFLQEELNKLKSLLQTLDTLTPYWKEFGRDNNKEATVEQMFPNQPLRKNYPSEEAFWQATDEWAESPEGTLHSYLTQLSWNVPILDQVESAKEEVNKMVHDLQNTYNALYLGEI